MKSCICTVIKDEHQYLDEWIQYHLHLGIDYIFVFEDIDSKSHEEITSKYKNVVRQSINSVLNEKQQEEAVQLKRTHRYNAQHLYFRNALLYIKNNYNDIDWCFVIDNDEFITLDDCTLNDVFSLYDAYDGFTMQWKCYGANGLISKPHYKDKGLIETYSKEIAGIVPDTIDAFIKTCHHLKTYKTEYFFNQHHQSQKANWVNTNFEKTWEHPCYKNIYIRHYITKSWQEYVEKIKLRSFIWGGRRNFDFFFEINSDLKPRKSALIKSISGKILVVLTYKQSGSQGKELEIALASWRKYCTFEYEFVVIGEFNRPMFEKKIPWVNFIECPIIPKVEGQYNQHLDVQQKMEYVFNKYGQKYNGFIWIADDNYAIKPFTVFDIMQMHYHSLSFTGDSKAPTNYWRHDKWKTRQLLDKEKLPHINYTTHYPCYFEFEKLNGIWNKFNMRNESYVLEDIYFNYYQHEKPIKDDEIRLGIWNYDIYKSDFQKALENPNIKFMCNSVEGWSQDLEENLKKLLD